VGSFTLRIIIILMETTKNLYISAHRLRLPSKFVVVVWPFPVTDRSPDGAEPLCLFLVTSASWRLRGVKTPPKQSSNGEQPQGALASERRGSLCKR
jgi:hypothetical protein